MTTNTTNTIIYDTAADWPLGAHAHHAFRFGQAWQFRSLRDYLEVWHSHRNAGNPEAEFAEYRQFTQRDLEIHERFAHRTGEPRPFYTALNAILINGSPGALQFTPTTEDGEWGGRCQGRDCPDDEALTFRGPRYNETLRSMYLHTYFYLDEDVDYCEHCGGVPYEAYWQFQQH